MHRLGEEGIFGRRGGALIGATLIVVGAVLGMSGCPAAGSTPGARPVHAEPTWSAQLMGGPRAFGISCPARGVCVAVGEAGAAHLTADGGRHWWSRPAALVTLLGISCVEPATCVAVGARGTVVTTADGGQTWMPRPSATTADLASVSCAAATSTTYCVAVGDGGMIIVSNDGGLSWSPEPVRPTALPLAAVTCANAYPTCLAVGRLGTLLVTTQGFGHWAKRPSFTSLDLRSVACRNPNACVIGGVQGVLAYNTDPGLSSWGFGVDINQQRPTAQDVLGLQCGYDPALNGQCVATGGGGFIGISANSGQDWTPAVSGTVDRLPAVSCAGAAYCYAVHDPYSPYVTGAMVSSNTGLAIHDSAGEYVAVPPFRVEDSRLPVLPGNPVQGPFHAGQYASIPLLGVGGVPPAGVAAVVLNVTVDAPTASGFITVWPHGRPLPNASNLNFLPGQTLANLVTVPVGDHGWVDFFNFAGDLNLIVDLEGWYSDGSTGAGARLLPAAAPFRIMDTRSTLGPGPRSGPLGSGQQVELSVPDAGGAKPARAAAAIVNITAVGPTAAGFLTAWPADVARPTASNLNFGVGQTVPNLAVVRLSPQGTISIYNYAGATDVLVDVLGWYVSPDAGGMPLHPLAPSRVLDTRNGPGPIGRIGPRGELRLRLGDTAGVPSPGGFNGVLMNVTVDGPTDASYLSVYASGAPLPGASNLNYTGGVTISNLVLVAAGPDGVVNFFNYTGSTHVIADVVGWF